MERVSDEESLDDTPPDDASEEESEFAEMDPSGRYGRYDEVLGKGAYKTVYKAFDDLDGIEVAWNQVKIHDVLHHPGDIERLYSELHLLKTLKHKNIIKFYTSWVDLRNRNVNFITEVFTSGTLRQYQKKHQHVKLRAIKHWSRQILRGLVFLHSREPPIIHRDLKCDNILINGNTGEVKIGDLGLATILRQASAAQSVIGTPEFMAPELYEEHYNELVDVYSFGMCLLEMLTSEYPYSECTNAAQIYRKVSTGRKPAALGKIKDPQTREFVEKCLATASQRLHARELLMDPFLCTDEDLEVHETRVCRSSSIYGALQGLDPIPEHPYLSSADCQNQFPKRSHLADEGIVRLNTSSERLVLSDSLSPKEEIKRCTDFRIKGRKQDDKKVLVRIRIANSGGEVRIIQFDFDVDADTAMSVASEMVVELDLSDQDVTIIAEMIDAEILALIPDWKPGLSFDNAVDDDIYKEQKVPELDTSSLKDESDRLQISASDIAGGTADDSQLSTGPTYGRFEEVGCNSVSLDQQEQNSDALELFSDFSADIGSDSSLDERWISESGADHDTTTHSLDFHEITTKADALPPGEGRSGVDEGITEEDDTMTVVEDYSTDSVNVRHITLQQEELELLQMGHEEALSNLRTCTNEEATRTSDHSLPTDGLMCEISLEVIRPSEKHVDSHRYVASEVSVCVNEAACSCEFDSDDPPAVGKSGVAPLTSLVQVESSLGDSLSIADNVKCKDYIVSIEMPGTLPKRPLANERDILWGEGGFAANNVSVVTDEKFKRAFDPIVEAGMAETRLDVLIEGGLVTKASADMPKPVLVNRSMPPKNEDVKSICPATTKRESYLELYKASNSKDKLSSLKVPESYNTAGTISKDANQEQLKKMADFADKLINNLTQSNSKYHGSSSVKNVTPRSGQQSVSVKSYSGTPMQGGQRPAVANSGVPSSQHSSGSGVSTIASVSSQTVQQGALGRNYGVSVAQTSSVEKLSNAATLHGQQGVSMKSVVPAGQHGAIAKTVSVSMVPNGQQSALSMGHANTSVHLASQVIGQTSCLGATFSSGAAAKSLTNRNTQTGQLGPGSSTAGQTRQQAITTEATRA